MTSGGWSVEERGGGEGVMRVGEAEAGGCEEVKGGFTGRGKWEEGIRMRNN